MSSTQKGLLPIFMCTCMRVSVGTWGAYPKSIWSHWKWCEDPFIWPLLQKFVEFILLHLSYIPESDYAKNGRILLFSEKAYNMHHGFLQFLSLNHTTWSKDHLFSSAFGPSRSHRGDSRRRLDGPGSACEVWSCRTRKYRPYQLASWLRHTSCNCGFIGFNGDVHGDGKKDLEDFINACWMMSIFLFCFQCSKPLKFARPIPSHEIRVGWEWFRYRVSSES